MYVTTHVAIFMCYQYLELADDPKDFILKCSPHRPLADLQESFGSYAR